MPIDKQCENCGATFSSYPSDNRRFCGLACRSAFRANKSIPAPGRLNVPFVCKECGNTFHMMQAYLTEYRKKYPHDPLYCSRPCSNLGRRKTSEARNTFTCANCGETLSRSRKPGGRIYAQQKYCSRKCKGEYRKKLALQRYDDGDYKKHVKRNGYVWISVPSLVTGKKYSIMEHRHNMSRKLGRVLLSDETVHHINGIRADNRLENLELFNSRHGPGQRVIDKVQFAIEVLTLYPEFARQAGYELRPIEHHRLA